VKAALALAACAVGVGLGAAAAEALTTAPVRVRDLAVLDCDPAMPTFCSVATRDGRVIVLYTGRERFRTVPRAGSQVTVDGFAVRYPDDAYLGVVALEVPGRSGVTTLRRTGTVSRRTIHGKVGIVRNGRVGFVSIRWVLAPYGGPVIGNVYERFSFPAAGAVLARARRQQWDRIARPFDRETWAFALRLVNGRYRLMGLARDG
jgi:hypothetical protein